MTLLFYLALLICYQVFRIVSMVLFIAYPSVSIKIFRLFRCIEVDGAYWLAVDMRLQCYTREWVVYALYGAVMMVIYILGLPFTIQVILTKHYATLFGPNSEATMRRFGFLYVPCLL